MFRKTLARPDWRAPGRAAARKPGSARALQALLLFASLCMAGPALADTRRCTVERLEGETLHRLTPIGWERLEDGALPAGAGRLATGPRTRSRVRCDDGTVVVLAPGTDLDLSDLGGNPAGPVGAVLELLEGLVGLIVPAHAEKNGLEVRTPLAIAAIRSTEWLVSHDTAEGTAVFVHAGRVRVRVADREATLAPGEGIDVDPADGPGPVVEWGAARIAEASGALGLDWR